MDKNEYIYINLTKEVKLLSKINTNIYIDKYEY